MKTRRIDPACALFRQTTADALECLKAQHPDDTRVHSARKALKRARTALRLLRPALGAEVYTQENIALRDAARRLSPLRDANSLYASVDWLGDGSGDDEIVGGALALLRKTLRTRLVEARASLADGAVLGDVAARVSACRERFTCPDAANAETSLIGLRKIFRQARKGFKRAKQARTSAALHEWRKRTKYLHAAVSALRTSGTAGLRKVADRTHEIADCLGNDHDLSALMDEVELLQVSPHESAVLLMAIDERRGLLQQQAFARGKGVFRKKAKRFIESLSSR